MNAHHAFALRAFAPPQSSVHQEAEMHFPNVERRTSEPRLSQSQADEERDLDRRWETDQAYEHNLNLACQAIQAMPPEMVDSAYIGKLLSEIADKARISEPEIADELDARATEITP